jgi:hypothetical protein
MKKLIAASMIAALALAPMGSFAEEKTLNDFAKDNKNSITAIVVTAAGVTIMLLGKLMSDYFRQYK